MCKFILFFIAKNNENSSVQRLHYYWKVQAGREYIVENDFSESQCNENKFAIILISNAFFFIFIFLFFLQMVQTLLHITTKNRESLAF